MKILKLIFLCFAMLQFSNAFSQTITLAVEATYPKDQAEFVYEPLKNWLEKKTGLTVEIESADNYYFYWRSARNNQPDFTLDASHVAAFRMQEKNYQPLARVQEDVSYHLISNYEPAAGQSIDEFLVGNRVVTLPNPNMGSVLFDEWFTDLFLQPQKIVTALSWEDVIEQVFAQSADAAIIPSSLSELYPNFARLKESKKYPGLTFLASPNVSPQLKESFKNAILSIGEDDESYDILAELNSDGFVEVNPENYKDLAEILTKLMY
ncbi:phosphate/phosphite/phosphonate ABC transporter substrate-binding protein [Marinicella litoralis]|uniref:ABC-type phosphate/phosphonate transport system substrate-binding protein n=1 Tax=Marinicella litoralis TaxID=644220 RepID=A0A4R6XVA3_9GAMM|nr:PhnD/SsuA/transferrin family substrate-binding protein [Marinicella litoralis]TDR22479.1 ABC-type phosphate/phosphonate transport system substrate-binding protein [Marinicella litoralis]